MHMREAGKALGWLDVSIEQRMSSNHITEHQVRDFIHFPFSVDPYTLVCSALVHSIQDV